MSFQKQITLYDYQISAHARPYGDGYWVGDFDLTKDGVKIGGSDMAVCRVSEAAALSGALFMGIRYVDLCLMPEAELEALYTKGLRHIRKNPFD